MVFKEDNILLMFEKQITRQLSHITNNEYTASNATLWLIDSRNGKIRKDIQIQLHQDSCINFQIGVFIFWNLQPRICKQKCPSGQWSLRHLANQRLDFTYVGWEEQRIQPIELSCSFSKRHAEETASLHKSCLKLQAGPRVSAYGMYMINMCADKARAGAQPFKDDKQRQKVRDCSLSLKTDSLPPSLNIPLARKILLILMTQHMEGGRPSHQVPSI